MMPLLLPPFCKGPNFAAFSKLFDQKLIHRLSKFLQYNSLATQTFSARPKKGQAYIVRIPYKAKPEEQIREPDEQIRYPLCSLAVNSSCINSRRVIFFRLRLHWLNLNSKQSLTLNLTTMKFKHEHCVKLNQNSNSNSTFKIESNPYLNLTQT